MPITVLDTSVAVKWFVDGEPDRQKADGVLEQVKNSPTEFAVPELFFNEMLAVLCRLIDDGEAIALQMTGLAELGIERIGNGRELMREAALLAKRFGLTGYDAVFLATAKLIGGIWLTADERAAGLVGDAGLVAVL